MKSSSSTSRKTFSEKPLRIIREYRSLTIPATRLHQLAALLYTSERVSAMQKTSLIFCSNARIKGLNASYRGMNKVTDVLSFAFCDPDLLGEVYIAIPRAAKQAREYGVSLQNEVLRLFVHGFFHLLGYDHEKRPERFKMEKKERKYLPSDGS
jgi:rRNA maturation RNase YbeY